MWVVSELERFPKNGSLKAKQKAPSLTEIRAQLVFHVHVRQKGRLVGGNSNNEPCCKTPQKCGALLVHDDGARFRVEPFRVLDLEAHLCVRSNII